MNIEIDAMLNKWADARNNIAVLEKKMETYKKIMKQYFQRNHITKYENEYFKVRQNTQDRSYIIKKNVPNEIWDQYAKLQKIEFLTLTEKKSSSTTSS